MSEVEDDDTTARSSEGLLALQLHAGPPMRVQYRNIRLKRLTAASKEPSTNGAASKPSMNMLGTDGFALAKGFRAELLYEVPRDSEGSWVSLCVDPKGRLMASDQYGKLYRIQPPAVGAPASETRVTEVPNEIGMLQGMCWVGDRFYAVVNGDGIGGHGSGLYVLQDNDGDEIFDSVRQLRKIEGEGEHGPHAVIPTPDGKSLYVICGNHTKLTPTETSLVPRVWQEDHLLPRMWDASGHAVGIYAPGGYICRTDLEGSRWELVSIGYRNAYDIAFNDQGELFTYDSDMEWDLGAPWYRPTRICHATAGSEFGWRSGSGNWPSSYPDSLPPLVELGTGSPTGLAFGYGSRFPQEYQQALFACDWSFGKVYAIHMAPQGGTYDATVEEFLTGTPLPITDIVVNPHDGALYFAVGGRRTFSALYRVVYEPESVASRASGPKATGEIKGSAASTVEMKLRRELERCQGVIDPRAVGMLWTALDHPDRFVRFAARTALEWQPSELWRDRVGTNQQAWQQIEGVLAASRTCTTHDMELAQRLAKAILHLNWDSLSSEQRLASLRALELVFLRVSPKDRQICRMVGDVMGPRYPATGAPLTMALSQLLSYTDCVGYNETTLKLMDEANTQEERVHYAYVLRPRIARGTLAQQDRYFAWFTKLKDVRGGQSLRKFLHNVREEAAKELSASDRTRLEQTLAFNIVDEATSESLVAGPVVKEYSLDEITGLAQPSMESLDFEAGRLAFSKALCFRCHRVDMEGGATGPDLTTAGRRFDTRYLVESIVDPDKEISDRFRSSQFIMEDGRIVAGRVANLDHDKVMVVTNTFDPGSTVSLERAEIEEVNAILKSEMPSGLLNTLTEPEIRSLFAYLRSASQVKSGAQASK